MKTGIFVVLLSSFFFAFVPNSAKIALDDGSSLFFLVFSRYAIGGLILFLFIIFIRGELLIPVTKIPHVIFSSICACILITLTYHAVDYLDVGIVMLILYCFPLGVAFVSYARGKSNISITQWSSIVLLIIGLYFMLSSDKQVLNSYGLFISFLFSRKTQPPIKTCMCNSRTAAALRHRPFSSGKAFRKRHNRYNRAAVFFLFQRQFPGLLCLPSARSLVVGFLMRPPGDARYAGMAIIPGQVF